MESTIRYHRELRGGDDVDVSCEFEWGPGKVFYIRQDYRRPDQVQIAELTGVAGLLDLAARRLVSDPKERFRALATDPALLGI